MVAIKWHPERSLCAAHIVPHKLYSVFVGDLLFNDIHQNFVVNPVKEFSNIKLVIIRILSSTIKLMKPRSKSPNRFVLSSVRNTCVCVSYESSLNWLI